MFHVKIKLGISKINGIGLFADQDINKNELVYSFNDKLDLILSEEDFLKLSLDERNTISNYGYLDKNAKLWHLAFDDIRFCNHSLDGNINLTDSQLLANRLIKKGEEITQNYEEFEVLRPELKK